VLTMPPASKAGDFEYSNLGFIIAGAIAEARTGKAWKDLIRAQIFAPLALPMRASERPAHRARSISRAGTNRWRAN